MADCFKTDIFSVEELFKKIKSANIIPAPVINHLFSTFNWKDFIHPRLSTPALANHSLYGAFQVRREVTGVAFRGKRYAYDEEWSPGCGIQLLKENTEYTPVKAAEVNMDSIKLDLVFSHLQTKLYPILTHDERLRIQSDWDRLRDKLDNLVRNFSTLPTLNLGDMPKQELNSVRNFEIPSNLESIANEGVLPELKGKHACDDDSGLNEVEIGQDIVVWTKSKHDR